MQDAVETLDEYRQICLCHVGPIILNGEVDPAALQIVLGRLHRLGQQGCVTVHFLLAPGTVDMARLATLGGRDQNMSILIDGQDEDGEMDSLVSMLKKLDIAPQRGQS